jgi:putative aldouronate transport system permease protein
LKDGVRVKKKRFKKSDQQLLAMCLPAMLKIFIFSYLPLIGIIIAFKDYVPSKGLFKSEWNGLQNFEFFFKSSDAFRVIRNTIGLNAIFIVTGLIFSVLFAILLSEVLSKFVLKTYQTIMFFPFFTSWVLVGLILMALLNEQSGLVNMIFVSMGGEKMRFYAEPSKWPLILTLVNLWKYTGQGAIIYYAVIVGISKDYYEAAVIDGASKIQLVRYVTLPFLKPMIIVLTLLAIGNIFKADFGMFYFVTGNQGLLYPTTDVIDTYVFRALTKMGDFSMGTAVGLVQSIVGFILILAANKVVSIVSHDEKLF